MADQDLNNNSAPEIGGNDTKTRKTVRLAPSITPASSLKLPEKENSGTAIADPLANRDTDTGNLEVLDDTQTRRTVKLKPIRPLGAGGPAAEPAGENTNTRKSVVLKPASAPSVPVDGANTNTKTRKTVVLKPASAPSVPLGGAENAETPKTVDLKPADSSNTNTRKTVVLKPASAVNLVQNTPAPAPAPAPAPVDDATQPNTKIKPAPAAGISIEPVAAPNLNDDRTVKIQRPNRAALKPVATPVPEPSLQVESASSRATVVLPDDNSSAETISLDKNDAASRATVVLPDVDENTATQQNTVLRDNAMNETVSLTTQDLTEAAAAAAGEPEPEEEPVPAVDNTSAQTVSLDEDDLQDEDNANQTEESFDEDNANAGNVDDVVFSPIAEPAKASPVYLVLILLTLLAMAFTATVTTLDYLGTWQNVKAELPIPGLNKR